MILHIFYTLFNNNIILFQLPIAAILASVNVTMPQLSWIKEHFDLGRS